MSLTDMRQFISRYFGGGVWRIMILCALVGLVAGFGAMAFYYLLSLARFLFMENLAGYSPGGPGGEHEIFHTSGIPFRRWALLFVPILGGLLSGALVFWLAPEAEGHGTDAAIDAYLHKNGHIRARVPLIKAVASALTIGSGGSAGREGPIAQIGAGFGSMLGKWLKVTPHERRILMAAGMGAGVGAIFHAPLAGSLFAAEVLYRKLDFEYELILPTVIASIVAYSVFTTGFGWESLFFTPDYRFTNPMELIGYGLLALSVAAGSGLYVKCFYGVRDLFKKIRIPNHFKPALGGAAVGVIGYFIPKAMGSGYGLIQEGFLGDISVGVFLLVALGKIATTSFSIGSGGSGGVFGPAVVIGGAIGGAVGLFLSQTFPGLGVEPGAFILVGMAGFFAAAANTPVSTIIMVSEMTGNYHLLVPSMLVCFVAYVLAERWTIFENQIPSRLQSRGHLGDMMEATLKKLTVREAADLSGKSSIFRVSAGTKFPQLIEAFSRSEKTCLPIVDDKDALIGVVDGRHLRISVTHPELESIVVASDLAQKPAVVRPEDSLLSAIQTLADYHFEEAIVVDPKDETRILGIISRGDIIGTYYDVLGTLMEQKRPGVEESSK